MKHFIPKGLIGLGVLILCAAAILWLNLASHASASPLLQAGLPVNGWTVCQDLGVSPSPAGGGQVQHMVMCTGDGWRIHVYCIEPAKPPPPLNTLCSMVNSTDFWCGDLVQSFREFIILQTPAPSATVTPSRTPTFTATFTQTFTPTASSTFTPTATGTPLPSFTPQSSVTPTLTRTISRNQNFTATAQATVFQRPHAGGPGNSRLLASVLAIVAGAVLLGLALLLRARRPLSNDSQP